MDNYYYLTLFVTIDMETAIRTLFDQRGWPFLKSDMKSEEKSCQNEEQYIATKIEKFTVGEIYTQNRSGIYTLNTVESFRAHSDAKITNETNENNGVSNVTISPEFEEDLTHNRKQDAIRTRIEKLYSETNYDNTTCNMDSNQICPDFQENINDNANQDNSSGVNFHPFNEYSEGHSQISPGNIGEIPAERIECNEGLNTQHVDLQFEVNGNFVDGMEITDTVTSNESKCYSKEKTLQSKKSISAKKKRTNQKHIQDDSGVVDESGNRKAQKKLIYCDECGMSFTSLKRFEGHRAKNGGQCVFTCEYCGKVFKYRKSKYIIHLRAAHTKERPHACDLCGKGFVTSDKLKIHRRKHTNERPCVCEHCGRSFYSRADLSTHKHYHHTTLENLDDLKCDICNVTFCSKRYLLYHKKVTHSETRDFLCSQCEKSFKSDRALKQHVKVMHTDIRDYKCEVCGQLFKTSDYLRKHRSYHTNERNFQCNYCDKSFYDKTKLIQHERTHTGVKPYKCNLCNYSCAISGNLSKHKKTHYKNRQISLNSNPKLPPPHSLNLLNTF